MGTTTLLDFGGLPWVVAEGSCTIDSSACVRSPNFPQVYGHNENCIILVNDTASKSIVVDQFRTEAGYDKLTVNGKSYSGGDGPDDVMPRGRIVWESDGSISKAGWRLCMNDVPTPPPTTAAPTLAPTQVQSAVTWLLAAGGQPCTNACLAQGSTCFKNHGISLIPPSRVSLDRPQTYALAVSTIRLWGEISHRCAWQTVSATVMMGAILNLLVIMLMVILLLHDFAPARRQQLHRRRGRKQSHPRECQLQHQRRQQCQHLCQRRGPQPLHLRQRQL